MKIRDNCKHLDELDFIEEFSKGSLKLGLKNRFNKDIFYMQDRIQRYKNILVSATTVNFHLRLIEVMMDVRIMLTKNHPSSISFEIAAKEILIHLGIGVAESKHREASRVHSLIIFLDHKANILDEIYLSPRLFITHADNPYATNELDLKFQKISPYWHHGYLMSIPKYTALWKNW
jgi:hypothetical protein